MSALHPDAVEARQYTWGCEDCPASGSESSWDNAVKSAQKHRQAYRDHAATVTGHHTLLFKSLKEVVS